MKLEFYQINNITYLKESNKNDYTSFIISTCYQLIAIPYFSDMWNPFTFMFWSFILLKYVKTLPVMKKKYCFQIVFACFFICNHIQYHHIFVILILLCNLILWKFFKHKLLVLNYMCDNTLKVYCIWFYVIFYSIIISLLILSQIRVLCGLEIVFIRFYEEFVVLCLYKT